MNIMNPRVLSYISFSKQPVVEEMNEDDGTSSQDNPFFPR